MDLSKEVKLHTSTTFHLAKTLVNLGVIRQEAESKKYRIGTRVFSLARGALDEAELLNVAMPVLTALSEETKESSHIAVRAGMDIFIIGHCDGTASIRLAQRVGTARPPHATAIGKVLLSGVDPQQFDKFINSLTLTKFTLKTIVDPEELKAEIEKVRRSGIAFDDGELSSDLRCLAAPVFDFRNQMIAAIGISAPLWRMGLDQVVKSSETVANAAMSLSVLLGYSPYVPEVNKPDNVEVRKSA